MLNANDVLLLIVDIQGKLAQLMHEKERLFQNLQMLIRGSRILEVPILWMEQNPGGIGPTIPEIAGLLPDITPISKMSFSCCQNTAFVKALSELKRRQVLIAGIETHICVYQTAVDLIDMGYAVHVVADAVSSRTEENKHIGLRKMGDAGATWTSVETVLFELLRVAEGDQFKAMLKIVK